MRRLSHVLLAACLPSLACVVVSPGGESGPGTVTDTRETQTPSSEVGESEDPASEVTSGEASTEDEAETSGEAPSSTFVPAIDFGTGCECDPFLQDCADGEKCVPWDAAGADNIPDANKCVPVQGDKLPGESCLSDGHAASTDDCGQDSYCFDLVELGEGAWKGTCRAFCEGTADDPQCGEGEACLLAWEGSVNLCEPSCDPLAQDCAAGTSCHFTGGATFVCLVPHAATAAGEPCSYIDDCGAGLVCLAGEVVDGCASDRCCTPYCEFGAEPAPEDDPCAGNPNHSCVAFFDEPLPGHESIGVCIDAGA